MSMANFKKRLISLNFNNYNQWVEKMNVLMDLLGYTDHISEDSDVDCTTEQWQAVENEVKDLIFEFIEDENLKSSIRNIKTAAEIWSKLKNICRDRSSFELLSLLENFRIDAGQCLSNAYNQLELILQQITPYKFINEESNYRATKLLNSLPDSYKEIRLDLIREGVSDYETIKTKLLEFEAELKQAKVSSDDEKIDDQAKQEQAKQDQTKQEQVKQELTKHDQEQMSITENQVLIRKEVFEETVVKTVKTVSAKPDVSDLAELNEDDYSFNDTDAHYKDRPFIIDSSKASTLDQQGHNQKIQDVRYMSKEELATITATAEAADKKYNSNSHMDDKRSKRGHREDSQDRFKNERRSEHRSSRNRSIERKADSYDRKYDRSKRNSSGSRKENKDKYDRQSPKESSSCTNLPMFRVLQEQQTMADCEKLLEENANAFVKSLDANVV